MYLYSKRTKLIRQKNTAKKINDKYIVISGHIAFTFLHSDKTWKMTETNYDLDKNKSAHRGICIYIQ